MFPTREMVLSQLPTEDEVIKRLRDIADLGYNPLVVGLDGAKIANASIDAIKIIEKLREEISKITSELQGLSEVERNKVYSKIKKMMFAEQDRKEEEQYKYLCSILQDDEEWGHGND